MAQPNSTHNSIDLTRPDPTHPFCHVYSLLLSFTKKTPKLFVSLSLCGRASRHCCSIVRMVLSNKKLKRKLRAELAETITKTVSESDPNSGGPTKPDPNAKPQLSLKELIDSATQKLRLTKREKRRKKLSLEDPEAVKSRRSGGGGCDPEEKEGGSESLVEKKKKKKRKREEEEVKDGALDSEENGVVREAKKSKKKKKKKKVKKKKEEGKSEEENNGAELGGEGKGVMETNKNAER